MAGRQADQQENRGGDANQGDDRISHNRQPESGARYGGKVLPDCEVIKKFTPLPEEEGSQIFLIDECDNRKWC